MTSVMKSFLDWWISPYESGTGEVALVALIVIGGFVALGSAMAPSDPCSTHAPCEVYTNVLIDGMQYPLCSKFGDRRVTNPAECLKSKGTD